MRRPSFVIVLASALGACAVLGAALGGCAERSTPAAAPRAAKSEPVEAPGSPPAPRVDGRLPGTARPLGYALSLDVDPRKERFRGTAMIRLAAAERTYHVVMHARDLNVTRATAKIGADEVTAAVSTRLAHGGLAPEELVLTFPRPIEAGANADVRIEYDAPFAGGLEGLYRVQDGGAWYAFTQFEPNAARRMFPCFDEPSFKVPFDVVVSVPTGMIAVANEPETQRWTEGDASFLRFKTTKPLPTYLVAIAVGDLEVREGAKSPVPIRIVTTKGKTRAGEGDLALDAAAGLVRTMADYFDVPYPYSKLDVVAVPDFGPGAMENAGLITFREELLLLDPRRAPVQDRRGVAVTIAHEIAHQWFGNLVTAEWWDDVWLNEAMATWMESRAVDTWRPKSGARLDALSAAHRAMDTDGLATARAIRQPVTSTGEAFEAFDDLTYDKGAALLAMTERWLGQSRFQAGLHAYLSANAYRNAKASTLLAALDAASRQDVTKVAASYLDQPGVPMITAHLACEPGSRWSVELREEPWRPLGSTAPSSQQNWTVPVCVRVEGRAEPSCTVIASGAPSLVAGRGACPAWIHPNAESAGYFRFAESQQELAALARAHDRLDPASRFGLVSNTWAMIRAGALPPERALSMLPLFDKETDRHVVEEVVATLGHLSDTLVEEDARPAFRAFAAARLARHKKALGWVPAANEDDDRALLRGTILAAMADLAEDAATIAEAEPIAQAWLKDPSTVDPDVARVAVELASRRAGGDRLDALRAAAKAAKTPQERIVAVRAMYGFDDAAVLERALDLALTDEVKTAEMSYVMRMSSGRRAARPILSKWVSSRWDKLRVKLPGFLAAGLVRVAGLPCTRAEVEEARAFFTPRAKDVEGAARPLTTSLEEAALCTELRARGAAAFAKALRGK